MADSSIKENRLLLRSVQEHLHEAQLGFGAQHEKISFVEVIHHPTSALPDLNYVTPRRNTAWISGQHVQPGLERLKALKRLPRVEYIDGLFPSMFAKTLSDLDLTVERTTRIMVYSSAHHDSMPRKPRNPPGVRLESVIDDSGNEWWKSMWRSKRCDILTLGVEPLAVDREQKMQNDILLYRGDEAIGAVRISVQSANNSGHIVAVGLVREARTPRLLKILITAGLRAALTRGCTLVFAPGETEADRAVCHALGFVDAGGMVCYAARLEDSNEVLEDDSLGQPILALRR